MEKKVGTATKWSFITEILAKLASPITNMVLARLLAPEAFGMVATITMVTSLADIFSDAGFQKYIVQHDFKDEKDFEIEVDTAFWTNLGVSLFLWLFIFLARNPIVKLVGNEGLGIPLAIACMSLPLTSFSSIQLAIFRKKLDFKTIFYARIVGLLAPFLITLPLAFITRSFWSLIIGNIATNLANAVFLTLKSSWKPKIKYSVVCLKNMISFSAWTLLEQLLGWANLNIGIFVVGAFLSSYYLGLYKMSMSTVNQVMSIITNSMSPVILASLSKVKSEEEQYKSTYYSFLRIIDLLIIPIGFGIFIYQDFVTYVLLGRQWKEAAAFLGIWSLMRAIHIAFSFFSMEVFVSLGKPLYAVITQFIEMLVLIPALLYSARMGYVAVYSARAIVVALSIIIEFVLLRSIAKLSVVNTVKEAIPALVSTGVMSVVGIGLKHLSDGIMWYFISIGICAITYFLVISAFPQYRVIVCKYVIIIKKKFFG